MTIDPDAFMSSGGKSAKFENVGDTVSGEVIAVSMQQQTEIGTGTPKSWPNGDP